MTANGGAAKGHGANGHGANGKTANGAREAHLEAVSGEGDEHHQDTRLEALVRMANHIAAQFPQLSDRDAAERVATHIKSYWEAEMRADLLTLAGREPGRLETRARLAVERLVAERVAAD